MENKQVKENEQKYVENHIQICGGNDEFTKAFYQALKKKLGNY